MSAEFIAPDPVYGVIASFAEPEDLLRASKAVREAGYTRTDAFTPFPVHGIEEALGIRRTKLPYVVLLCGIAGGLAGYLLQYYCAVIAYPLNIGGRPLHSWPAFIPVTFETTIIGAAFSAVFGMLAFNGLPTPHHPVFNAPEFGLASRDRFFLLIEARDKKFDADETLRFLQQQSPLQASVVHR
jgi:hypothetical protein